MMHISSREFNHDVSKAQRESKRTPVIITVREQPAHVLLSFKQYETLIKQQPSMAELLASDDDIEFTTEPMNFKMQEVDLD